MEESHPLLVEEEDLHFWSSSREVYLLLREEDVLGGEYFPLTRSEGDLLLDVGLLLQGHFFILLDEEDPLLEDLRLVDDDCHLPTIIAF